jgi:hypothetical protein
MISSLELHVGLVISVRTFIAQRLFRKATMASFYIHDTKNVMEEEVVCTSQATKPCICYDDPSSPKPMSNKAKYTPRGSTPFLVMFLMLH